MPFVPGDLNLRSLSIGLAGWYRGRALHRRRMWSVAGASSVRRPRSPSVPSLPCGQAKASSAPADALNSREVPLVSDLVREAAMASALAALMSQHVSVLWVGGFAHWARIVERLRCRDFAAPDTVCAPRRRFTRARLGPSALARLTGQYPSMVAAFARAPQALNPFDAMRLLLHEAAKPEPDGQVTPPVGEARKMLPSEPVAAIDLARTGCMRGTWRQPPASANSRSWPSSCSRPAPQSGPAMRRGS